MKMKFELLSFVIFLFLTGCFANQTGIQPEVVKEKENPMTVSENKITLDKVKKAFEAEGIEMFLQEDTSDWILNNVKTTRFSISRPTEKAAYLEFLSIYVYDSEQERKEGVKDFNLQKEKYNMVIPNIYELKNVLILYWHHENLNNAKNTKFGKQIESALQKIK